MQSSGIINYKAGVSPMIHSARPTIAPVVNIVFAWNLFFLKWGRTDGLTDGRTDDICKNNYHYRPWLWVGLVDHYTYELVSQKQKKEKDTCMRVQWIWLPNLPLNYSSSTRKKKRTSIYTNISFEEGRASLPWVVKGLNNFLKLKKRCVTILLGPMCFVVFRNC